ncbi:cytochrome c5 family protein [Alkalilimnicola sp. S0819]|nr:cytochrome c5 family protein [Alkalilimnicola sp. S0819]MPQ16578.1 cytochrome c5 family protein [Alkalilimnicola sp. S0819]
MAMLTAVLIFLATSSPDAKQGARAQLERERATERLQPVAAVRKGGEPMPELGGGEQQAAAAASGPMSAEQINGQVCAACHASGVLGAPVTGEQSDWAPRLAQGFEVLVDHAINGIRAMPPRGGNSALSDEEVRDTVAYMLEQSGLSAE